MKKILALLTVALFGTALVGCGGGPENNGGGEEEKTDTYGWHLTQWEVGTQSADFPKDVYLILKTADSSFELYQDVNTDGYVKYTGSYTFDAASKQISGTYSDGLAWAYSYTVSGTDKFMVEEKDATAMVFTATEDATYKLTYSPALVPQAMMDTAGAPPTRTTGVRLL